MSLASLPGEIYLDIARFLPPYPDLDALSQTCCRLRSVYQALKWRRVLVTTTATRPPSQRHDFYMTVGAHVVFPDPQHYASWFMYDEIEVLELADYDPARSTTLATGLCSAEHVGRHFPRLRRLQATGYCPGQSLRQILPLHRPSAPALTFVDLGDTNKDGKLCLRRYIRAAPEESELSALLRELSVEEKTVTSPAVAISLTTNCVLDSTMLTSIGFIIASPALPLIQVLFSDSPRSSAKFPNLKQVRMLCPVKTYFLSMAKITPEFAHIEEKHLPSSVSHAELNITYIEGPEIESTMIILRALEPGATPASLPSVTALTSRVSRAASRLLTRYRFPRLQYYSNWGSDTWFPVPEELLLPGYSERLVFFKFSVNLVNVPDAIHLFEQIPARCCNLKKLSVIFTSYVFVGTAPVFAGIMALRALEPDVDWFAVQEEHDLSPEVTALATRMVVESLDRLCDMDPPENNELDHAVLKQASILRTAFVESAEMFATTILSRILNPHQETEEYAQDASPESLERLMHAANTMLFATWKDTLTALQITELFYSMVVPALPRLEYLCLKLGTKWNCLPYSPRLHRIVAGKACASLKQVLVSMVDSEDLSNFHWVHTGSETALPRADIFRTVLNVRNVDCYRMPARPEPSAAPVNVPRDLLWRTEAVVDLEHPGAQGCDDDVLVEANYKGAQISADVAEQCESMAGSVFDTPAFDGWV